MWATSVWPTARTGHAWEIVCAINGNVTKVPQLLSGGGLRGQRVVMGRCRVRNGYGKIGALCSLRLGKRR